MDRDGDWQCVCLAPGQICLSRPIPIALPTIRRRIPARWCARWCSVVHGHVVASVPIDWMIGIRLFRQFGCRVSRHGCILGSLFAAVIGGAEGGPPCSEATGRTMKG